MRYISTRNADLDFTAAQAITQGLSRDGGLLTPAQLPALSVAELEKLSNMTYQQRAVYVMGLFLNDFLFIFLCFCSRFHTFQLNWNFCFKTLYKPIPPCV